MADTAQINYPAGIAIDNCGNVYIADAHNWRIRKITYAATHSVITIDAPVAASVGSVVTVSAFGCCIDTVIWLNHGVPFDTTTTPFVTYTKTLCSDSITAVAHGCGDSAVSALHVVGCSLGSPSLPEVGEILRCYPNPVDDVLYISTLEPIRQFIVTNLLGQVVFSSLPNNKNVHVDMKGLPGGTYFVRVNGVYVQRVVKR